MGESVVGWVAEKFVEVWIWKHLGPLAIALVFGLVLAVLFVACFGLGCLENLLQSGWR